MKGQRGRIDKFRKIVTLHSRWICYNLCALESCLKRPRKNKRSKEMLDNRQYKYIGRPKINQKHI